MVSLEISGKSDLLVLLAEDGTTNRIGPGGGDLCIAQTDGLFARFMEHVDTAIFEHAGRYTVPERVGSECVLTIVFYTTEGSIGFQFEYGAESEGPPNEIRALVVHAVEVTQPWYDEFLAMIADAD